MIASKIVFICTIKVQGSMFRVALLVQFSEIPKPPEANEPLNPEP